MGILLDSNWLFRCYVVFIFERYEKVTFLIFPLFALLFPFIWAPTESIEEPYKKIPVIPVDTIHWCEQPHYKLGDNPLGCYKTNYIEILPESAYTIHGKSCVTVWDHEAHHAFGYEHGEGMLTVCGESSVSTHINTDGDHLYDFEDDCPEAPETYNRFLDHDGCPDWVE